MDKLKLNKSDNIFSTGVFLKPEKCLINDVTQWRWIAVGFEGDTYLNGKPVDVYDYANTLQGLIISEKTS
ncbi:MAG: hypothetical protein HQK63_05075 [Desulfamplus sp.]|nr:hypothetical protein [Desulfamplus sp.]